MTDPDLQYTISDARYAKNMVALAIPGIGGWKSLAAMILTTQIAPRARWSGRECAYIVSKPQAARFVYAIEEIRLKREGAA